MHCVFKSIPMEDNQFAFRSSYQSTEVLFIIRQLIQKGREWGQHIFMMDGDLYKAYDSVEHGAWTKRVEVSGVRRPVIAACVRAIPKSRVKNKATRSCIVAENQEDTFYVSG